MPEACEGSAVLQPCWLQLLLDPAVLPIPLFPAAVLLLAAVLAGLRDFPVPPEPPAGGHHCSLSPGGWSWGYLRLRSGAKRNGKPPFPLSGRCVRSPFLPGEWWVGPQKAVNAPKCSKPSSNAVLASKAAALGLGSVPLGLIQAWVKPRSLCQSISGFP